MKKAIYMSSLALLLLILTACLPCVKGSGEIIRESREVSDFNEIDLSGSGEIFLTQGEDYSFEIESDKNILERIETIVRGKTLFIKHKNRWECLKPSDSINIYVTMPEIIGVDISGSGRLRSEGGIIADDLDIDISGSGKVDLELAVKTIEAKVSGSGDFDLAGVAEKLDFNLSGSGNLRAFDLKTSDAKIKILGSGKAEVYAEDNLDITLSGSGKAYYKGRPVLKQSVSGSGKIESVNSGESQEVSCSDYLPADCPEYCVVCPPCAACSSISCQTEEFCAELGIDRTWYEEILEKISNFQECVDAGNAVMESYPRQCQVGGEVFVEEVE